METPCSGALMEDIAVMRGDKLILRGLKFHGYHGVKPEERNLGQKFLVDVDAWLDLRQAGNSDCLSDTVSYTDIYRIVREVVEGPTQNLLESVAQLIASTTFTKHPQISAVRVKVGKPHVAVPGSVDYLGVEILRFRRRNMARDSCQQDASHQDSTDRFCIICCNEVKPPFKRDTISGHVYCAKHNFHTTLFCLACRTHQAGNKPFIDFDDGWKLCVDCHSIAIMDEKKLKPIIKQVQKFYGVLNMRVDEDIPIFLVDKHTLNKHDPSFEGITFDNSNGYLTVSSTQYRAQPITIITSCSQGNKVIAKKETRQLTKRPVTAMKLLYGMPEVVMGEHLAHEMMHAWLRLQRLERQIKEGICTVMAYKWLNWLACAFDDSSYKSNKQVKFVRKLIEARKVLHERRNDIVGDGFQAAKAAVDKFGLQETLDYIAKTKSLPQ